MSAFSSLTSLDAPYSGPVGELSTGVRIAHPQFDITVVVGIALCGGETAPKDADHIGVFQGRGCS